MHSFSWAVLEKINEVIQIYAWHVLFFYGEIRIVFIKPNMMGSVDKKSLIWIPVDNNSCSSCIYHEITLMGYVIKILYFNTSIDDVDSHTPYFDVFV